MEFDAIQQKAIDRSCDLSERVVPVTGQAGTGKTALLKEVHERLTSRGLSVCTMAPTGKAAKRIFEATGIRAVTVHRGLEYSHPGDPDPKTGKPMGVSMPRRNRANPLTEDVFLIDEYAMVNQTVHRALFDALPRGAGVRVYGDVRQLEPIEEHKTKDPKDSAFTVLLEKFNGIELTNIYRQGEGSGIILNCHGLLRGLMPRRTDDFHLKITNEPVNDLEEHVLSCLDNDIDYRETTNQIIVPGNKGWVGTKALNTKMQLIFQPHTDSEWLSLPRHSWDEKNPVRVTKGTKVIYTNNDYNINIFNGETGIVVDVTEYGEVIIDLGDREVVIPPLVEYASPNGGTRIYDPRKNIDLAYVVTTHKSQGSEYEHVTYVLNKSSIYVQSRANMYTGWSRGRRTVTTITDQRSLSYSVNTKQKRN